MKTLQEIENTSFERLEQIARDESVRVPADLRASVQERVSAAAIASSKESLPARPSWYKFVLIGTLGIACIATFFAIPRVPQDTYDDPLLAYAKVEETFALISSKMDLGVESVRQAEEPLETVSRILNNQK